MFNVIILIFCKFCRHKIQEKNTAYPKEQHIHKSKVHWLKKKPAGVT